MAFFKAKVGDTTYELKKLNLGDMEILKDKFGLKDLTEFSSTDISVIVGLLALAIYKADPLKTIDQAAAEAREIDFEEFATAETEDEESVEVEAAPLEDAKEVTSAPAKSGKSDKTPKKPGTPS